MRTSRTISEGKSRCLKLRDDRGYREQQKIVRLLDEQFEVIERNEREIDAALKRSGALRQAILKKAFTGRLVPQDPADELASALLARMKAGHATAAAASKRGSAAFKNERMEIAR